MPEIKLKNAQTVVTLPLKIKASIDQNNKQIILEIEFSDERVMPEKRIYVFNNEEAKNFELTGSGFARGSIMLDLKEIIDTLDTDPSDT